MFPVVRIEMNIAPSIGPQEIMGGSGIHHGKQKFHSKTAACFFKFFTLRQIRARRLFITVSGRFFEGSVANTGETVPGNEAYAARRSEEHTSELQSQSN